MQLSFRLGQDKAYPLIHSVDVHTASPGTREGGGVDTAPFLPRHTGDRRGKERGHKDRQSSHHPSPTVLRIQSAITSITSTDQVSSMAWYSLGAPVSACWKRWLRSGKGRIS